MSSSIVLPEADWKQLPTIYRKGPPHLRLRAHILLLLAEWASICTFLFCSSWTIRHWKNRYRQGGWPAVLQDCRGCRPDRRGVWLVWIVYWILDCCPQDFGLLHSRWCCRLVVLVLLQTRQRCGAGCTGRIWFGDSLARSPSRSTRTMTARFRSCGICWRTCPKIKPRFFKTRSMSMPSRATGLRQILH